MTSGKENNYLNGSLSKKLGNTHEGVNSSHLPKVERISSDVALTGKFSDYGVDSDGNGLINHLVLTVEVNVYYSGYYQIEADLVSNNPHNTLGSDDIILLEPSKLEYKAFGLRNFTIPFEIRHIYSQQMNISITANKIWIRRFSQTSFQESISYLTRSYQYLEFDPPSVYLTGNYYDHGLDTDGDDYYDQLMVEIECTVTEAAFYYCKLIITTSEGEVETLSVSDTWSEGTFNLSFSIKTRSRYEQKIGRFYTLSLVQFLENWYFPEMFDEKARKVYTTRIYNYSEFDPPNVYLTDFYWDYGFDSDFDGYFNQLIIQVELNVVIDGEYRILLYIEDNETHIKKREWNERSGFWTSGFRNISIPIEMSEINFLRLNTSYIIHEIRLETLDDRTITIARDVYSTRIYQYNEFDRFPAEITGRLWDNGIDTDGDGKFNLLKIITELNSVEKIENYSLTLKFLSNSGELLSYTINLTLDEGIQVTTALINTSDFYYRFYIAGETYSSFRLIDAQFFNCKSKLVHRQEITFSTGTYHYADFDFDRKEIIILNDDVFSVFAQENKWTGLGTAEFPYIINSLNFNDSYRHQPYIEIRNTDVCFSIVKCTFIGGISSILLINTQNGYIKDNKMVNTEEGIILTNCENIRIENNTFTNVSISINIEKGKNIVIHHNEIKAEEGTSGIHLMNSSHTNLSKNCINGFTTGITLKESFQNFLNNNMIYDNEDGIKIDGVNASNNIISSNLICNNQEYGIIFSNSATDNLLQFNDFIHNRRDCLADGISNDFVDNFWPRASYITLTKPNHLTKPQIISPNGGEIFISSIVIHWTNSIDTFQQDLEYSVYYSHNLGSTWNRIESNFEETLPWTGSSGFRYTWFFNRSILSPGTNYLLRVVVTDPFDFFVTDTSDDPFIIRSQKENSNTVVPNPVAVIFFTSVLIILVLLQKISKRQIKT